MSNRPKVLSSVVDNDLCIGCGLCTYKCPSDALKMQWNDLGFLVPDVAGDCCNEGACLTVCPFNPDERDNNKNETGLAKIFLTDSTQSHEKLGRFIGIYAGYSKEYRPTSSSGGIASYVFEKLLENNIVDHIISVGQSKTNDTHYEYVIKSSKEDLKTVSKTKYYPVTLATILPQLKNLEGKIAIVGVACFVKAIRLAQNSDPYLQQKIPFVAGIICGGVKSRFFTEYLASKSGANIHSFQQPDYRVKDANSTASDYSFKCTDNNSDKLIKMQSVGDMWGTGLFKANACDFCDDVTTELADISLGDAWLEPFNNDGQGTNVVISRSILADQIINNGIASGELAIERLPLKAMLASQQGSFNHRHDGLYERIKENNIKNIPTPRKRYGKKRLLPDVLLVQKLRRVARQQSLIAWKKEPSAPSFDKSMKKTLLALRYITKITHYRKALLRKIQALTK
ncbi:Coenzyme F420 hydrogenase/dehydrogenase, beta subunit C-terminal domain [Pseudomonas silesiensis]